MSSKRPQGIWVFSAVNSRDINQALKRLKTKGRATDITPEEICDEIGISRDRAQWYPDKEEEKPMSTNKPTRWKWSHEPTERGAKAGYWVKAHSDDPSSDWLLIGFAQLEADARLFASSKVMYQALVEAWDWLSDPDNEVIGEPDRRYSQLMETIRLAMNAAVELDDREEGIQ